jgi:hypothetical protein
MIIFFNKQSGEIKGTIEGRVHNTTHLNQWSGDKEENDRLIITWIKNKDEQYEPDITDLNQKQFFIDIDKKPMMVYDFYVDPKSKVLQRKE